MCVSFVAEKSVQCVESCRCVAARGPGCRRACMTLHTLSNTARRSGNDPLIYQLPPPRVTYTLDLA